MTAIAADVTSDDSVANLFKQCGAVDHVVVTAAQLKTGPFKTVSMDDVRATMEGKFWGAWRCARFSDIRPGGSLTLVSGFLSIRPRPNSAIVGAANGALESLARSLAIDLAPVRVNCVSPGIIDTPIRAAMPEAARREMLAKIAAGLPVGRVGQGEDIAKQIVAFMTNGFMTGSIVYLDGGGVSRSEAAVPDRLAPGDAAEHEGAQHGDRVRRRRMEMAGDLAGRVEAGDRAALAAARGRDRRWRGRRTCRPRRRPADRRGTAARGSRAPSSISAA